MSKVRNTVLSLVGLGCCLVSAETYNPSVDYYGLINQGWSSQATKVGGTVEVGMYARTPGIGYSEEILVHFDETGIQGQVQDVEITAHVTYANPGWVSGVFVPEIRGFEQNRYNLTSGIPTWGSLGSTAWTTPLIVQEVSSSDANSDIVLKGAAYTQLVQDWVSGAKANNGLILTGDFKHETRYMKINSIDVEVTTDYVNSPVLTTADSILSFEDINQWNAVGATELSASSTAKHLSQSMKVVPNGETVLFRSNVIPGGFVNSTNGVVTLSTQGTETMPLTLVIKVAGYSYILGTGVFTPTSSWNPIDYMIPAAVWVEINNGASFEIEVRNTSGTQSEFLIDRIEFGGCTACN